jgi:DNA-binding XRE family transcriptional regulator
MTRRSTVHARPTALALAIDERRGAASQTAAAAEIGISQATLSTVERGGPVSLATARKLAKWLGGAWTTDTVADAAKDAAGGGA